MKIAVYTCMKNEEKNVPSWFESACESDVMVVLDTGSTDRTRSFLSEAFQNKFNRTPMDHRPKLHVEKGFIDPWRFDVALNTAMALIPTDVDICVNLAADERLSPGWRDALVASAAGTGPGPTKFHYDYQFAPTLTFRHDRIHSRTGYSWRWPFHEGLCISHGVVEDHVVVKNMKITQVQSKVVDRMARDMALAQIAIAEYPRDPRMVFYVGRQYMYAGRHREALSYLERYAQLARSQNYEHPLEQAWCAEAIAQCWRAIGGV